jgi:hypothetical protein
MGDNTGAAALTAVWSGIELCKQSLSVRDRPPRGTPVVTQFVTHAPPGRHLAYKIVVGCWTVGFWRNNQV